jgi:hypothetical protein
MESEFGVTVGSIDIDAIEANKDSEGYTSLMSVTRDIAAQTTQAQADVNVQNLQDTQKINAENMEESLRIQREEMQRAQRYQTEAANFAVHQLDLQADVAKTAAASLGQMGGGMDGGGGFNPAGIMAGMAMGGVVGQQMAGMMGGMMGGMNQQQQTSAAGTPTMTPPPLNTIQYNVAVNGQTTGPFTMQQLMQMAQSGQFTAQSMVWTAGMAAWAAAGTVQELASLFTSAPPPPPPPIS